MTLSVLVLSNLDERLAWLKHRLRFLYVSGHQGETVVGVWGGHDKIPDLQAFCDALSPKIRVVSQNGAQRITSRIVDLAKGATGEHIVIQGDDDFLLPSAFANPLHLLKNDASVLCAQGRVMSLALEGPLLEGGRQGPTMIDWFPLWQALEDETLPRFTGFMKNACTTWHAMFRRAQFIERMQYMDEAMVNTKVYAFYEAMGELYSVIKGKIVIFDEIYLVKGLHPLSGAHTFKKDLSDKMPPYIVTSPHFSEAFTYTQRIANELLEASGVNTVARKKEIMDGMVDFIGVMLFKRRRDFEENEKKLRVFLAQQPTPPDIRKLLALIEATAT